MQIVGQDSVQTNTLCKLLVYIGVRDDANPFDPTWERYFEDRYGLNMVNTLSGRGQLIRLWLDLERACVVCQQRITAVTGWHVHHIVRRVDGGPSARANLVIAHPVCHQLIHSHV
jgi:RNA-directed DNA polymerase